MCHPPSCQCFYHWVDTFNGGLLVTEGVIRQVGQCFYHWVDTFNGGLLVPEGVIRPVVSVSITGLIPLMVDYSPRGCPIRPVVSVSITGLIPLMVDY